MMMLLLNPPAYTAPPLTLYLEVFVIIQKVAEAFSTFYKTTLN
jgi:hypothetical protein